MSHKRRQDLLIHYSPSSQMRLLSKRRFYSHIGSDFFQYSRIIFRSRTVFHPWKLTLRVLLSLFPWWCWLFHTRNLYLPRRSTSFSDDFFVIVRLVVLGMLVVWQALFFYRSFSYSRIVFWILGLSAVVFISTGRFIVMKLNNCGMRVATT